MDTALSMNEEALDFDPFAGATVERVVPTSEAQREIWLADKLGSDASLAFNESANLHLTGALDVASLSSALNSLVERHESLRATLGPDGTELLIGASSPMEVPLTDWRSHSAAEQATLLQRAAQVAVTTVFNLEQGPLFRAAIYQLGDNDYVLMMTAHHVVCDGWSWGVITRDLGALYSAAVGLAPIPDAPLRYGDYVLWENSVESQQALREHERFWLQRFSGGSVPSLDLPTDRPRAPVRSFRSDRLDYPLPADVVADLRKLGAKAGASLFATLLSGFAVLLQRLTGQDDLVVGVPAAGQSASGMHELVGHCVNLLPIRLAVDPKLGFDAFVAQSGNSMLDAFEHQTLTYGSLLAKLPIARDPSRLPLVSVMFNVDQVSGNADLFPDLKLAVSTNPRQRENFELFINATPVGAGFSLECQYNSDLFDVATIARWMQAYETLLRGATKAPATALLSLDWLAQSEHAAIQALQPAATVVPADALMHSAFVCQAAATPARTALRYGELACSYQALDERSNQLAHTLRAKGIGRGGRVGICLNRGIDMVAALLGVLKSGASYVPLDPGFPKDRLTYYAEDAQLALLLTESDIEPAPRAWTSDAAQRILNLDTDTAWAQGPTAPLAPCVQDAQPADTAYIIYTSGSTGKPKGVCVPHRAVANFLLSMRLAPGMVADDVLAAVTTLSFDIAVLELMLPLAVGAEALLVPRETAMDGNLLAGLLRSGKATMMQATPGMWRILLDTDWQGPAGFKALVGGESLPPDLAREMLKRCGELWNMYGPTETTIWSTVWPIRSVCDLEGGMSIGLPIANTHVWILNEALQPCPIGVPGEICIGGMGVAAGYLDRPELTADRFVIDPFSKVHGARLYRTGDRGRWRNDGLLEHLGRLDFQVKVRGYRIELGEIEALCAEVSGVLQSLVITREDQPGDVRLVAYLKLAEGQKLDETGIRNQLRQKLPDYMLPQHMVVVENFPLLPNGKVDRKALPAPEPTQLEGSGTRVKPRNALEQDVATVMERVLNLPGLGVHDDFFVMGGHSLLAAQLVGQLNRQLDLQLGLRVLFESPTVEKLTQAIEKQRASALPSRAPIVHRLTQSTAPLTLMQERILFVEQMTGNGIVYNVPSCHRFTGPMSLAAFDSAFQEMVHRQSALRTCIVRGADGSYQQCIKTEVETSLLAIEDLSSLPAVQREAALRERLDSLVVEPFDLENGPLFKAQLFKLGAQEHALYFCCHHIIWDGWSFDILYAEMSALYEAHARGVSHSLPELRVTYGDFTEWHRQWIQTEEIQTQLEFWKNQIALGGDVRVPVGDLSRLKEGAGKGASEFIHIPNALVDKLRDIARMTGSTLSIVTLSVYAGLISQWLKEPSPAIGLPVRGRNEPELESIMGFFNNMLPLRLQVKPEKSMLEWIAEVRRVVTQAFANQDVPFELLAQRSSGLLYQAMFTYQDARARQTHWGSLAHDRIPVMPKGATEDLNLCFVEIPAGIEAAIQYNADVFLPSTTRVLMGRFLLALERLVAQPEQSLASLLRPSHEEEKQLAQWGISARDVGVSDDLVAQIESYTSRNSHAIAWRSGQHAYSRAQIQTAKTAVQAVLRPHVREHGAIVAVSCKHPLAVAVVSLAALECGARVLQVHAPLSAEAAAVLGMKKNGTVLATDVEQGEPQLSSGLVVDVRQALGSLILDSLTVDAVPHSRPQPSIAIDHATLTSLLINSEHFGPLLEGDTVLAMELGSPTLLMAWTLLAWARGAQWVYVTESQLGDAAVLRILVKSDRTRLIHAPWKSLGHLVGAVPADQGDVVAWVDAKDIPLTLPSTFDSKGVLVVASQCLDAIGLPVAAEVLEDAVFNGVVGRPMLGGVLSVVDDASNVVPIAVGGHLRWNGELGVALDRDMECRWRSDGVLQRLDVPGSVANATQDGSVGRGILVEPADATESSLCELWCELLGRTDVGVTDDFFRIGGHSMLAMRMMGLVNQRFGAQLPFSALIAAPTIRLLARRLNSQEVTDSVVLIRSGEAAQSPLFLVHDGDGETLLYRNLALRLNAGRTVYGLQPVSGDGLATHHTRIPDLARHFVECMRRVQPQGPYLVGGLCAGGVIAFEIACQLQALGQSVAMTAVMDIGDVQAPERRALAARERVKRFAGVFRNEEGASVGTHTLNIAKRATQKVKGYLSYAHSNRLENNEVNERAMRLRECLDRGETPPDELKSLTVRQLYYFARNSYVPTGVLRGDVTLFRATRGDGTMGDAPAIEAYSEPDFGWSRRITGEVRAFDVPGGHSTMLQEPNVEELANQLQRELSRVA